MSSLGDLVVKISADHAAFQSDIGKVERATKDATNNMSNSFGKFGGSITSVTKLLGGMAAAGAVTALAGFVKQSINAADEIGKLSQKIGMSVEELSALKYAGSLADVSIEQLGVGMKQLSKNLVEAEAGSKAQVVAFKALGIETKNTDGKLKSNNQIMVEVADSFAGMEDGAAKTAIAMKLFGKSGADLIPLLNAGADGLREMTEEGQALGVVLSEEMAKNAEIFNDNLTRLSTTAAGLGYNLAELLLPALNDVAEAMVKIKKTEGFGNTLDAIQKFMMRRLHGQMLPQSLEDVKGEEFKAGIHSATESETTKRTKSGTKTLQDYLDSLKTNSTKGGKGKSGKAAKELPSAYAMEEADLKSFSSKMAKWWEDDQKKMAEDASWISDQKNNFAEAVADMLQKDQQLLEGQIEYNLSLIDTKEAFHQISKAEAAEQRIALNEELLTSQEQWLETLDKATDPAGWLAQSKAIKDTRDELLALKKTSESLSQDMSAGFAEGIQNYKDSLPSLFEQMSDMAEGTASSMQESFKSIFSDGLRGDLEDMSDYFSSFTDSLIDMWADAMAKMTMNSILGQSGGWGDMLSGLFGSGGGGTSLNGVDYSWVFEGLQGYASGTNYVPKTGPYMLHQGEAVVTAADNARGNSSLSISVPVNIEDNKRLAADLRNDIEETVIRVLRRHS